MKKLFTFLISIMMLLALTGCGRKMAINTDEFISKSESKGYQITDVTAQFREQEHIKEATIATSEGWQVEFYVIDTEENAISMYETNKSSFEASKGSSNSETMVNMKNYGTYSLNSNETYKYLCRVDNTLIYVDVEESYKDEVKSFISELGY